MDTLDCDVLIFGCSLGAVAAAVASARNGVRVILVAPNRWLGGQMSSQGVSTPDEYKYIETTGASNGYNSFRHRVRAFYKRTYGVTATNIGDCWVNSYFAVEPKVAHNVLREMLAEQSGNLQYFPNYSPTAAELSADGNTIVAITAANTFDGSNPTRFAAPMIIDGTDLGDLLPLTNTDWIVGAESRAETEEPDAPDTAQPTWIQWITYPFAVEHCPFGEDHTIAKPDDYETLKAQQKYSLKEGGDPYKLFQKETASDGRQLLPLFNYRRVVSTSLFHGNYPGGDVALINVAANDYNSGVMPTDNADNDATVRQAARRASLGYLYWLQTESPRDDGSGFGYPNLKLRPDFFDTDSDAEMGLSCDPYIRESRRIKSRSTVRQQEIMYRENVSPFGAKSARAKLFGDSVGIGWYALDIHGAKVAEIFPTNTKPFQIPLGTLIPIRVTNLLPASKNLGVTHLTNAAYRVHPIEWHIGEAVGALAAFCLRTNTLPGDTAAHLPTLRHFQRFLVGQGVPIFWWSDLPSSHPAYAAAHLLGVAGILSGDAETHGDNDGLAFRPGDILTDSEATWLAESGQMTVDQLLGMTRSAAAIKVAKRLGLVS